MSTTGPLPTWVNLWHGSFRCASCRSRWRSIPDRGEDAATRAALVKDLGTRFEQDSVELAADLLDHVDARSPEAGRLRASLATAQLHSPLFTLRGGTNEVLRGVVARGMGVR